MADQLLSSLDFVDMVMYAWTDGNHAFVRLKAYTTHITCITYITFTTLHQIYDITPHTYIVAIYIYINTTHGKPYTVLSMFMNTCVCIRYTCRHLEIFTHTHIHHYPFTQVHINTYTQIQKTQIHIYVFT